jgi:hypothetical protein
MYVRERVVFVCVCVRMRESRLCVNEHILSSIHTLTQIHTHIHTLIHTKYVVRSRFKKS